MVESQLGQIENEVKNSASQSLHCFSVKVQ